MTKMLQYHVKMIRMVVDCLERTEMLIFLNFISGNIN